jgi:NAD(P)-dependent dehydrogenase (short-subunit alcohol dehydrogenase family)
MAPVTEERAADHAIQSAVDGLSRMSRIDMLVNNAGYGDVNSIEDTSLADFRAQIETNLFGVIIVPQTREPRSPAFRAGDPPKNLPPLLTLSVVHLNFGRRDKLLRGVARIISTYVVGQPETVGSYHPTAHPNSLSWHSTCVDCSRQAIDSMVGATGLEPVTSCV